MEKRVQSNCRLAILGPESSGKTTLCEFLRVNYDAYVIEEYARDYLETYGSGYSLSDLITIAEQQFERNQDSRDGLIVCDTEMITAAIWAEDKFGNVPEVIQHLLEEQEFDLYLLCRPDIEWQLDELRENPHDRGRLFNSYQDTLEEMGLSYKMIQGEGQDRYLQLPEILASFGY